MRLFWLFLLLPIVEIALFVSIGGEIGVLGTLAFIFLSAAIGIALLRREGQQAPMDFQQSLRELQDPGRPMAHRSLKMIAGLLLIVPGFLTSTLGLLLLIPGVRGFLLNRLGARVVSARVNYGFPSGATASRDSGVIDGEYVVQDDPYVANPGSRLKGSDDQQPPGNSGWTRH